MFFPPSRLHSSNYVYICMFNKLLTSTKKYAKEKENTLFLSQETLLRLSRLSNIANIHILTVQ
jgi:hypothetical protein